MNATIEILEADITTLEVDAIVNAANDRLLRGGGVCGAIHAAAGPELEAECAAIGACPTGEARITAGYGLPAAHVIHAVGPIWQGGGHGEAELLAACYRACYTLADENGLKSIAFPAISTGIYGYPLGDATAIALAEAKAYLGRNGGSLERIVFCCFGSETTAAYRDAHSRIIVNDAD
jgi:O-acetyl-ADP-ribose deacetylase (regulator of RNase III)